MTDFRAKILVVDDVPANIKVLSTVLRADYEIFVATNGPDGLELARAEHPDLILLDIMMPEMDGLEVCRRLKADSVTADIPVIFVSAMSEVEDETAGLEQGGVDYITKPISPPIVRARVRIHLELKHKRELLEKISLIDGLTGIANRRRFEDSLNREWRRCQRNGRPLSLVMLDIDHFKAFNDDYGHIAGDDCLKKVAAVLDGVAMRGGDLVARFGGEEFACLLPETTSAAAAAMADKLRQAVLDLALPHPGSSVYDSVTVSAGVATLLPGTDTDPETLVNMADHYLYEAKVAGRNRVYVGG